MEYPTSHLYFLGIHKSESITTLLCNSFMPCHAMPCHAMPCHAMPCHAMPCHAMPCHAMPCHAMPCHRKYTISTTCAVAHDGKVGRIWNNFSVFALPGIFIACYVYKLYIFNHDLWVGPTPEFYDSRTPRHSAHALSRLTNLIGWE